MSEGRPDPAAAPSQVELEVLGWLKDWVGYPHTAAGSFLSDGSAANLAALGHAREAVAGARRDELVLYVSDQGDASVPRAALELGFRPEQVRVLPSDERFRLAPATLNAAMGADLARGRTPVCVVAQGGATPTGAVDPLAELVAICRKHGAWLHVDATFGGYAVLADGDLLPGLAEADSIALDPGGWLSEPFKCGCLLVRDGHAVEPVDLGSTRALQLWLALRDDGLEALRSTIRQSLEVAAAAARRVEQSEALELMAPPSLGVFCFRRSDLDDDGNAAVAAALERGGPGPVSSTWLHGRFALRLCVLDDPTTAEDVERVLSFLETAELETEAARYGRRPAIVSSWPGLPEADVPSLRALPLFAGLDPGQAAQVAARASLHEAESGEEVIEQWSLGSEFFVILEGTASVAVDGEPARELGPGDFFGELRALRLRDGYAYPRLASVRATSRLRLLVFPEGSLDELVERYPPVGRVIREAIAERLPRHS
jgi:glutamate/tyrosine decarboxylase-like PLP-dependent enzyme